MFFSKSPFVKPFKSLPFFLVALLFVFMLALPCAVRAAQFTSYFHTSPLVMLVVNPNDGAIIEANPAASVFYGWSKQALQTMNIADINTLSKEEITRRMQMANMLEQNYFLFTHRTATQGERRVEVYSAPLVFEGKNVLISTIVDASLQKNLAYDRDYFEALAKEALEREHLVQKSLVGHASYAQLFWSLGLGGFLLLTLFLAWQVFRQKQKRQEAEKELRYFKLLFEDSEGAYIVATDAKGVISFFNKGAQTLLGYRADEVVGKETPVLFHDADEIATLRERLEKELALPLTPFYALTHAARKNQLEVREVALRDKEKNLFHLLLSVSSLKNAKGEIIGYLGVGVDESKQFETAQHCREKLEAHKQTLRLLGLGTWTWEIQTGQIQADDQCYRLLGHLPHSFTVTFETWMDFIHPDDRASVQKALQEQLAQGDETLVHCSYSNANGHWVRMETYGKVIERGENGEAKRMVGTMRCLNNGHRTQIHRLF